MEVYLRIAPETYLKRAIVGGFTKVFEFARCFRNEGIDATHLQDFTMLEGYCAYYNYKDNMKFLQDMLTTVISKIWGSPVIKVKEHPIDLSPLARANDNNSQITDRFQLIINGAEIINAYSELVDPVEQRERLLEQARCKANGDEEAMMMDEDYILAMEYGMPPISGWGMGIDRVFQVLMGTDNIRDSIMFPLMRPVNNPDKVI